MARDYAKKGNRTAASRGRASKGGGGRTLPGWLWLVTGLTVGLFIAFLVFLSQHERSGAKEQTDTDARAPAKEERKKPAVVVKKPASGVPAVASAPEQKPEAKAPEKKPMNYDFYTKLEKFEVEVPEDRKATSPRPVASPGSYILQAGSFKSAKDADTRKAELALLGIRASVQSVTVEGNSTYHRVRIGPYSDLDRVKQVRQTLRDNHIDFVTLRERS
jgi:cell division protein FtsN